MSIVKRGLNTFDIKVIGVILMVIDHMHEMFFYALPDWLSAFGRPVGTMFFFVSVVGFSHTRSKRKYLSRLYVGAVIMAIGSLIITNIVPSYGPMNNLGLINNIFRDLFLGVVLMYGVDFIDRFMKTKRFSDILAGIGLILLPILLAIPMLFMAQLPTNVLMAYSSLVPNMMTAESNFMIYIIPLLYIFREKRLAQVLIIVLASLISIFAGGIQWLMILAVIPVYFFNGQKGRSMKGFFYIFYPAHIWILYTISCLIS
ncbi:TraX family protein [Convivina praedatoris]|uniref:TraX protein n=1 Tax=Convivina praedatoris TaxID=2880963 RepID=A0ABN8H995_9LACO|nr:TraX family protein [Convivina sp. LMG 32447]CAH1852392.1 hypothetical protein R077815_00559 [Convivina sp. LMG 32447]CAH1853544.1 hypothetical protein R078138_00671 [Convivina sp. LMG 32447]CAH1854516.1 hypothetical protein LMG032447_00891 [Convivina sp. LMG 32447]